ncbi:MAG: hypothetical protein NDI69_08570 [Bacteriovoracaceae bacterium]|nr:hypothetical protein [Bacteriovoracaceae bacterium]
MLKQLMFLSFMFLMGCNPGSSVKVQTAGIYSPVLYSINDKDASGQTIDLGEHILTDDPIALVVKVYNKTEYSYTDLEMELTAGEDQSPSITFMPTPEGELAFPGHQGTCGKILPSKKTCEIRLVFSPREGREYLEKAILKFKNYVDPEEHVAELKLLAGLPASLTFTNDKTQYTFGELVGVTSLPVVEREDNTVYSEELEIINAGGLPAKTLTVTMVETCASTTTNVCPTGMFGAYTMINQCPLQLMPGEKCKVSVSYLPKNQDLVPGPTPEEMKEINYRSTVKFDYVKDPTGASGALNGYFNSISSNIEARFKVSMSTMNFETPIVSGNRETRAFRINNLGYREGEIKGIAMRDVDGSLIASCSAKAGSSYLDCFDSSNNLLSLAGFPFIFKDRNACLAPTGQTGTLVSVGSGCIFDITFQPSVTYLTNMPTQFQNLQPEVVFDSRWKGAEKIVTKKIFNLSASSIAAGRLVPSKFQFNGIDYPITGEAPGEIDLGRLALQSPGFYKRKQMVLSFKNIGNEKVTNLNIKDGSGKTIPVGGTPVNLGAYANYYYVSVSATESTCTVINPNETCSISLSFAPIGRDTNAEETANMFDAVDENLIPYKSIIINYDSGAKYTDTNIDGETDYTIAPAEARFRAQLIRKGMMMELSDDNRNVSGIGQSINVIGDTSITHIYLRNIGTGPVPYIRYLNPPSSATASMVIEDTPSPASLGAEHDCLDLVDTTSTAPAGATPDQRIGFYASLPKDESCVYTIRYKTHSSTKRINATNTCNNNLPTATSIEEGSRFYNRELTGEDMWEYCKNHTQSQFLNINLDYYDGDASDPNLPAGSTYGTRFSMNGYNYQFNQYMPARIIPHTFTPALTATLYRPSISYPALSVAQPAITVAEKWFYGLASAFFYDNADPSNAFIKGNTSASFVPGLVAYANRANYDYILYLGSFPQDSPNIDFPVMMGNLGQKGAYIQSFNITPDASFTVLDSPTIPMVINANQDVTPLNFRFTPTVPGEHQMLLEFSYENGRHLSPLIYKSSMTPENLGTAGLEVINAKILVVAHVQATGTYPYISMTAEDYEVLENPGTTPTETLGAPYNVNLSWNNSATQQSLTFDTIKLTATATANDVYAKKILTYTNNTGYSLQDFRILYKTDTSGTTSKTITTTFVTMTAGTTCTTGMTLAAGASCKLVLRYQPGATDTSDNFVMALMYRMGVGQYVMQNVGISLLPRSPGQLAAAGLTAESINYKVSAGSSTITRFSYPLSFGTSTLNVVPKTFVFDQLAGAYKKIQFTNTQSTKASLLLSYQKYLNTHSLRGYSVSTPAPTSVVPEAAEYRIAGDGNEYVTIHQVNYTDSATRVKVEGTRGCLFGDDENNAAIPAHQKGFNNTTSTPCYIIVTFNANFEYLREIIQVNNGDDMRGTASELWYYSVNRSSTASVWVHIKGTINPDVSVASGSYSNVSATDNKRASFYVPSMTPANASMGSIVGIRVLMAQSASGLNDPYNTTLKYVDIRPGYYDPMNTYMAEFISDLTNGQYHWFRTVAIRKDARFLDNTIPKRFVGLNANEYLSATSSTTTLQLVVPPTGNYYFHTQKLIVEKSLYGGVTYDTYATASGRCTGRTKMTLKNPSNVSYSYKLINTTAWGLLLNTPAATSYTNMTQISHWTSDNTVSIDTKAGSLPGFVPNSASQQLDSSGVFYVRNSSNPAANVNWAVGGVPGTTVSDYDSYVDGTIPFASSRCMVALP